MNVGWPPPAPTISTAEAASAELPIITFAIRLFNCEKFVEDALQGALSQTYARLEIIVADDCSTDRSFAIAERIVRDYDGPHAVELFRNPKNLGTGGQMAQIARRMRGDILIFADSDDVPDPRRAETVNAFFRDRGPDLMGATSFFDIVDYQGRLVPTLDARFQGRARAEEWTAETLARGQGGLVGAVSAFRRRCFEVGQPLDELLHSEDAILGLRALLLGHMATIPEVLVRRRVHLRNISGPVATSWSGEQFLRWSLDHLRQSITVAAVMWRDIDRMREMAVISEERRERLRAQIRLRLRETRLLRASARRGFLRKLRAYAHLLRMAPNWRGATRRFLDLAFPSLAIIMLRRNDIIKVRALQESES